MFQSVVNGEIEINSNIVATQIVDYVEYDLDKFAQW